MAVDITKLLEELQRKISAADSNTSENDLYYMVKAVSRGDGSSLFLYDSAGSLPTATSSASSKVTLGYDNGLRLLYSKKAQWTSIKFYPDFRNQGQTGGYYAGGKAPGTLSNPSPSPWNASIEFFPFSNESSVTDLGNLTGNQDTMGSWSSATHGYTKGKRDSANTPTPTPGDTTRLSKFTFGSSTPVVTIADAGPAPVNGIQGLHAWPSPQRSAGCFGNFAYGYAINTDPSETNGLTEQKYEKFPYASENSLSIVGDSLPFQSASTGVQSLDHGYIAGGFDPLNPGTGKTAVRRMPFYSDTNDTGVGDLAVGRHNNYRNYDKVGVSSQLYGYIGGGQPYTFNLSEGYEKFSWSNNVTGSAVGKLSPAYMVESIEGISGQNNGYWVAGKVNLPIPLRPNTPDQLNNIRKFPYSSDVDTSSVGTLLEARYWGSSMQY